MKTLLLIIILLVSGCAWSEANQALDDFNVRLDDVQTTIDTQLEQGLITPEQAESATEKVTKLKAGADLVDAILPDEGPIDIESVVTTVAPLIPGPVGLGINVLLALLPMFRKKD